MHNNLYSLTYLFLIFINFFAFFLYRFDKLRAISGNFRISEKLLLFVAILGGSIGSWFAMYYGKRHKVNKLIFKLGVPLLIILQIIIIRWFFLNFKF